MSQTNRPDPRGSAGRPRRQVRLEACEVLEGRQLLAPVVASTVPVATFTAATKPTNDNLGTVTVALTGSVTASAAPLTSVAQLTSANSFGGDIVRIKAGPGGDFGKGVYAISRGAGENADPTSRAQNVQAPINRPGVIYRVDPATGRTSVFFDLNTVQNQITEGGNGSNGSNPGTGLVNWYDMTFDSEGVFDGKPSLFVSSLSATDPTKNVIYRIGPDGSFLGLYIRFTAGATQQNFVRQPSAILVPPVEQQNFLSGLFVGTGNGTSSLNGTNKGGFAALFFNANEFAPGQDLNGKTLPNGVTITNMNYGPQVALTSANSSYFSPVYSAFTDFGTPGAGGVQAAPGLSGVQGLQGELLIGGGATIVNSYTAAGGATPDAASAILTPFRRFEDQAFDYYGYFSYGLASGATAPTYQGSLFETDLSTGLSVQVTPVAPLPTTPVNVPIQGSGGPIAVTLGAGGNVEPVFTDGSTTGGNLGGRVVRISPNGTVTPFAIGFHTSGAQDANAFLQSSLSITFSADGTTMYVSDDDGIWQFKTVTDVANATSGSLIGLNDLRTLGVPYDGQDSAVAVVDTGIDALVPNFRGRVSTGYSVLTNGVGNDDTAAAGNGHGTLIAGVIAQFVPQATLTPVNVFTANQVVPTQGAAVGNATTAQNIYVGLDYVTKNPFVKDPVRPNAVSRVIGANIGFGTTSTYNTETGIYKSQPQITVAFKNKFAQMRQLGISPIAAAGQFGTPAGSSTTATVSGGDVQGMAFPAVLNEVISVTGSYPFPYSGTAATSPIDPGTGVVPRPPGPILLFGNPAGASITAGGTAANVAANDLVIFKDKILASSNRGLTTDYTAPELDVPTWARTVSGTITGSVGGGNATSGFNVFNEGGTSLSSAIVSGSFAMVASALDYWQGIAKNNGVTVDGYLNTPMGTHQLNFGKGGIEDLSAYANTDGINSILEWTAVPATDAPNTLDTVNPPTLFQSTNYRNYARIDVGNAIAAIEGSIALNYLFSHGDFDLIDANKNGLITAQELQNFEDNAANTGMAEAGAMARFLGGTAAIPTAGAQRTSAGESPDQPDVLARRYNFFDYAADGQLNGAISIDQLRVLAHTLLPAPDSFVVVDRQRASSNGFLLDPKPNRNISDLQHVLPTYAFVPKRAVARFRNISPAKFGVGKGQRPSQQGPIFTLFADGKSHPVTKAEARQIAKSSTPTAASKAAAATNTPAKTTGSATGTTTGSGTTTGTGTTATKTTGSTGTATAVAPGISPTTINTNTPNGGNAYLAALSALAQGGNNSSSSSTTAAKTTTTTTLSTARPIGTPAAATASGTGSLLNDAGTASKPASAPATDGTSSSSATSGTATSTAMVHTQVVGQAAAQGSQPLTPAERRAEVIARHDQHVAPNPNDTTDPAAAAAKAVHSARVKKHRRADSSNKFDFWHPWNSIKKIVQK